MPLTPCPLAGSQAGVRTLLGAFGGTSTAPGNPQRRFGDHQPVWISSFRGGALATILIEVAPPKIHHKPSTTINNFQNLAPRPL